MYSPKFIPEVVESYSASKAVKTLKNTFGRNDLLVEVTIEQSSTKKQT